MPGKNDISYEVETATGVEVRTVNPAGEFRLDPGERVLRAWSGEAGTPRAEPVADEAPRQPQLPARAWPVFNTYTTTEGSPERLQAHGWLVWQEGLPAEAGITGTTLEDVADLILRRLRDFQAGPFPCEENQAAIAAFEEGRGWLIERTQLRRQQGVEGSYQPHHA